MEGSITTSVNKASKSSSSVIGPLSCFTFVFRIRCLLCQCQTDLYVLLAIICVVCILYFCFNLDGTYYAILFVSPKLVFADHNIISFLQFHISGFQPASTVEDLGTVCFSNLRTPSKERH